MRIVGLNIEKGRVGVTVVQRKFGKTELLDSVLRTYDSDEDLTAFLRGKAAAWAGARIAVSIPGHLFTQRTLELPFSDRKRVEKALPFEMEDLLPFDLEDVVLEHLVLERGPGKEQAARVLCMALPKAVLRRHLDLLAGAGIEPQVVMPSFAGLAAVAKMLPADGAALLLNGRDVCLRSGGTVKALRSLGPAPGGGLRQALQSIETEQRERVARSMLLVEPDDGVRAFLAGAGMAVDRVTPELGGKKVSDAGSLGAALSGDVNFRKGEFAYRIADEGARRRRRTLVIAAAVAAVLFGVNIGVKMSIVRSGYGKLDAEVREIFRQTFPDARQVGDPVRQMRDKLGEAKRTFGALGTGSSALDAMKTVTDGIPKEVRVTFTDFLLEGDRLRLQGEALSFEAVDRIKAELGRSPLFTEVAVEDTRMGVDSKVKFRFEIKLQQAM